MPNEVLVEGGARNPGNRGALPGLPGTGAAVGLGYCPHYGA